MTEILGAESIPAISPHFRFQWEPAQDAFVILYPEGMVKLSPSAGEILKRCDGKTSIDALLTDLRSQFPGADLDQDVFSFLTQAHAHGWLRIIK